MKNPRFMMKLLACSALVLFLAQCSSDDPSPAEKPADVYVAGSYNTLAPDSYFYVPAYWKNGELIKLSESEGDADAIAVKGSDVYVIGVLDDGTDKLVMWKNGVMSDFTDGSDYAYVFGMQFFGDDLYAVGQVNGRASYWKNGVLTTFAGATESRANSILVDGADVYVVGFLRNNDGYSVATIWKNGTPTPLSDGTGYADASGISKSNDDIHVSGTDKLTLTAWVNGVSTTIGAEGKSGCGIGSLAIHNNDTYIAGYENSLAKVWKNGVSTTLTNPAGITDTYSFTISFDGEDMYVFGYGMKDANTYPALVWKNNELVSGYDGTNTFSANAMCIAK